LFGGVGTLLEVVLLLFESTDPSLVRLLFVDSLDAVELDGMEKFNEGNGRKAGANGRPVRAFAKEVDDVGVGEVEVGEEVAVVRGRPVRGDIVSLDTGEVDAGEREGQ
jgi:hypothetical protein